MLQSAGSVLNLNFHFTLVTRYGTRIGRGKATPPGDH